MTIRECYERLHGDYDLALKRLMNERLIDKFILKFPADNSIAILRDAIATCNAGEMFRGAHTLKGVAANLAFTELQMAASQLTEQLRPCNEPVNLELYEKVEQCYSLVIETLLAYEAEKEQ
ncbi:MAG: Hpt domain-containing protein [Sphaerochaetaceae bacterium]|nr:Hpt domain-containing protein [Sphaerochaetaceae bacterium]